MNAATVLIDDYSEGAHALILEAPPAVVGDSASISQSGLNPAHVLGGQRDTKITVASALFGKVSSLNNQGPATANALSLSNDPQMSSTLVIEYPNIGDMDLTQGASELGFKLTLGKADKMSKYTIEVIDGLMTASSSQILGALTPPDAIFYFPYSGFSNPLALMSADMVRITLDGDPAGDYLFRRFETYNSPDSQSMIGSMMIGFAAMGWFLRRRST